MGACCSLCCDKEEEVSHPKEVAPTPEASHSSDRRCSSFSSQLKYSDIFKNKNETGDKQHNEPSEIDASQDLDESDITNLSHYSRGFQEAVNLDRQQSATEIDDQQTANLIRQQAITEIDDQQAVNLYRQPAVDKGDQLAVTLDRQQAVEIPDKKIVNLDKQQVVEIDDQPKFNLDKQQKVTEIDDQQTVNLITQQTVEIDDQQTVDLDRQQAVTDGQQIVNEGKQYVVHFQQLVNMDKLQTAEVDNQQTVKLDRQQVAHSHLAVKLDNQQRVNSLSNKCVEENEYNEPGISEYLQNRDDRDASCLNFGSLDSRSPTHHTETFSDNQLEINPNRSSLNSPSGDILIKGDKNNVKPYTDLSDKSTDDLLKKYFADLIALTDEGIKLFELLVKSKVVEILSYCHEEDKRIPQKPIYVGSFPAGLKVGMPNEFDVDVQMDIGKLIGPFRKPYNIVNYRLRHCLTREIKWEDNPIMENLEKYEIIETKKPLRNADFGYGNVRLRTDSSNANDITFQGLVVPWMVKSLFYNVLKGVLDEHKFARKYDAYIL